MPRRTLLTKEREQALVRDYRAGIPVYKLGGLHHVGARTARRILREHGVKDPSSKPQRGAAETYWYICQYWKGYSSNEVAEYGNVTPQVVLSMQRRYCPDAKQQYVKGYGALKRDMDEYGLDPNDYRYMYCQQGGVCAICGRKETSKDNGGNTKRLAVDHKHDESGKVRGLLCHRCNFAIGLLDDSPDLAVAAAEYLSRSEEEASVQNHA